MRAVSLFQKIDELGFITNPQWFLSLSRHRLKIFLNELIDIWNYRAQLSQETKRKVEPQRGNPFYNFNIRIFLYKFFFVKKIKFVKFTPFAKKKVIFIEFPRIFYTRSY